MRHRKAGVHLSRTSAHRKALFSNLVAALLTNERIRTTDAKAKETRRLAERTITWARRVGEVLTKKPDRRTTEESARVVHADAGVRLSPDALSTHIRTALRSRYACRITSSCRRRSIRRSCASFNDAVHASASSCAIPVSASAFAGASRMHFAHTDLIRSNI